MGDLKAERFKRVAALRVQKVLDSMDNLGKCSNRGNYEYSSVDVKKMMGAIKSKLRNLEGMFGAGGGTENEKFRF